MSGLAVRGNIKGYGHDVTDRGGPQIRVETFKSNKSLKKKAPAMGFADEHEAGRFEQRNHVALDRCNAIFTVYGPNANPSSVAAIHGLAVGHFFGQQLARDLNQGRVIAQIDRLKLDLPLRKKIEHEQPKSQFIDEYKPDVEKRNFDRIL